jgi:hypothetical protein
VGAHESPHAADGVAQIAPLVLLQLREERQPVGVGEILQHDRVVQGFAPEPAVAPCLQARAAELGLAVREQRGTASEVRPAGICSAETGGEPAQKFRECQRILPCRDGLARTVEIVRRDEECDRTLMADEGGERLVELGVAGEIDRVVEQFVEDHLR